MTYRSYYKTSNDMNNAISNNHPSKVPKLPPIEKNENHSENCKLTITSGEYDTSDPKVWGPSFWFTLHNGAAKYPINASEITKQRMKGFILGIQVMLPCELCSDHATAYIEENWHRIDEIVNGRKNLFNFFVDFHNKVNQRYGKPVMSYSDAYNLYSGKTCVNKLSY